MKEFTISPEEQIIYEQAGNQINKGVVRKYSIDLEPGFKNQTPNLYSFSGIIDDQFLNPNSFSSFQDLPHSHQDPFALSSLESPTCYSPSTPSSFGFRRSQSRLATVEINHLGQSRTFSHVRLFLVSDVQDMNKAGLLFKYEDKQVDLKIQKSEGKDLEKIGKLSQIKCQLWIEEFSSWVGVVANIQLQD